MASKSSTATLFSTYKASKIHRNYSRNGANSSRYVVGSVGKACGKHIRFGNSSGTSCGNHSHANVAIATQVLNPSAIGGSLKNQRLVEHFGPKEDDEISFLSGKSRAVCSKVCFYGISIGVTVIMITGLVIAVGYMQSEKDRIATRPVKLAQGQDFQSSTTHQPPAVLHGTTTTAKSTSHSSGDSNNEIFENSGQEEEDDMDEIGVDNPPNPGQNGNRGIFNFKVSTSPEMSSSSHHQTHYHHHPGEDINDDENNISDEYHNTAKSQGNFRYGHHDPHGEDEINTSPEEEDLHQDITTEEDTHPTSEGDRPFSEVRVKPPSNFFAGISFEIPIYRVNSTASSTTETVTSATPTPSTSSTTDVGDDYVEHLNNQNDLGETETESGSSSASVAIPPTVPNATELEETKELETRLNHSNSGPNFTSLVDSSENPHNESDRERGDVLLSDLNNRNYANAKKYNQNPSHSQDEDALLDSNSEDFTQTKHFGPSPVENGINSLSQPHSDRYKPNFGLNRDDGIVVKTSSRFSHTKSQHDKTNDNDEDFAIGESTTSTVATLQTDIFDADEFQTSASEESEIDADVESDDKPIIPPTTRPKKLKNRNNNNDASNNNKDLTFPTIRPNNKGQRKGKIPRPSKTSTTPPPYAYHDIDYETETTNVKTNGRIKDGKKLVLKSNKKFNVKFNGLGQGELSLKQDPAALDGGSTTGSGEEIPNLNYKVDFSKYIPKTTPTPPENNDNIEYQPPHHGPSIYPNFNFSPPPLEHHKPFDLEEYLNKHAKKTGSPAPSGDLDSSSLDSSTPQPSSNLDLSALAQYQSYKVDTSSSPLLYTTSSGNLGGDSSSSGLDSSLFSQQDNQFSKRTFYNSESYSNPNTNHNSFAHLLGPQTPSNNFGAVTATGATLNLFQPQANYNFDGGLGNFQTNFQNNNGGAANTYNVPNFNALSASAQSNAQHGFSVDANGAFSLISPSNLPYPNIPTGGSGNNYGGGGGGANLGGNNYQNTFSFNNEPISSSKNLVLTTGAGQVPTYNTITQGIHLLSLLSGRGGNNENDNGNGYDQLSSGSSIYQNIAQPDIQQSPSLTDYSNNFNRGGPSNQNFNNGNWKNSGFPSQNFQGYGRDLYPNKNFGNSDHDQDSSASGTFPSFSRSIVLKAPDLDISGRVKAIQNQNSNWGSTGTGLSSSFQKISTQINSNLGPTPSPKSTQPKSLSIKILPKSHKPRLTLAMTPTPPTMAAHSSELESLIPKSRKKQMDPEPDIMEVGESRVHAFTTSGGKNDPKFSTATVSGTSVKGLKSGFFN